MLDYCPKRGKQNSHRARAARNKNPRTNRQTQDAKRPTGGTNHRATRPNVGHNTRTRAPYSTVLFPLVPVAGVEPARPTGQPLLRRSCLPIPPHWQEKRGAETNTRDNHATTMRPTSGTHAHQPHHRPAQPACADTLNRPTQTGPTYSPTPRAPWRKHASATRTHPAHHPMPPHTPA